MTDASCESRQTLWRLSLLYAAAFLTLLLATHRLWLGSTGFPQVPAFRWLISAPDWVDAATAGIFLVGAAISGRRGHFWVAATAFVLVSACLNQHRLQVWAYHLSTAGLFATFSAPGRALPRLRWLTISIYAWSAVSKLDVGFAAGPGQTLLGGLAAAFQMNPPAGAFGKYGPWLMPIGELMTAVALAVPRWRRVGLWLSIAMHVLLLLAVGPLGLGHELGVQIWNVLFLVQNVILFRQRAETIATTADGQAVSTQPRADRLMGGLLAFVVVMPALQPWSFWDVPRGPSIQPAAAGRPASSTRTTSRSCRPRRSDSSANHLRSRTGIRSTSMPGHSANCIARSIRRPGFGWRSPRRSVARRESGSSDAALPVD
jgi:hypothetical protein